MFINIYAIIKIFLDPILYEIMEDPVILPGSQISIDRKSITTHLLSDATDPFNRKPLTIDQVIPSMNFNFNNYFLKSFIFKNF